MTKKDNAYLTVYLSMSLLIILSLYLVLIEGAARNGARLEAACISETALQSVMAEYNRELFRQYNILAIDSSYGTNRCGRQNVEAHLSRYLQKNMETKHVILHDFLYRDFLRLHLKGVELTHVSVLSDHSGAVFRKCAVDAVRDDVGIAYLEQIKNWTYSAEINGLNLEGIQEERERLNREWKELQGQSVEISETESVTVDIPNPMEKLDVERGKGFLRLIIANPEDISTKAIVTQNILSHRIQKGQVSMGNMPLNEGDIWDRFLFQEYLCRYMGNYLRTDKDNALDYQIEYLINGMASDAENLRGTALKLCALRETANILYLISCDEKRTQAKNAATVICGLLRMPNLVQVMEDIILLGWASAESIYDVKALYDGGKIPLLKDDSSWHYGLNTSFGDQMFGALRDDADRGLDYDEYLRIIMSMTSLELLTVRAMEMVEADIRLTPGNSNFRIDACYDCFSSVIHIGSVDGHELEIERKKEYR